MERLVKEIGLLRESLVKNIRIVENNVGVFSKSQYNGSSKIDNCFRNNRG